jgi:hypothetical protein
VVPVKPKTIPIDLDNLPRGIYTIGNQNLFVEGTAKYGSDEVVIFRPIRTEDWRVMEIIEFATSYLYTETDVVINQVQTNRAF